ncbi:MAG TPA: endopeptidase La, partial [Syntrophobacteria bacterium]|nr:endopeptidase La [Syntrophobacteria bacterium]
MSLFRNDDQAEAKPRILPLLPLRDIIVFPHMVVPLFVGREKSIAALEEAQAGEKHILLAAQKKAKTNEPAPEDIFGVGTVATIIQLLRLPDGTVKVLVEGKKRWRIRAFVPNERFFQVEAEPVEEPEEKTVELEALMRSVQSTFEAYVKLNKRIPPEMLMSVSTIEDPARLGDTIVAHLSLKLADKQEILEIERPSRRLERLYELMQGEIEILQVEKKIRTRVKKQMERTQKEYYLNEQMQAIQKELGERDEFKSELQELEEKIKQKKMSKEATLKARKELKKLKMMSPMSAEATVVRNYIDWILSLPWSEYTEDKLDIAEAERILDEDHYGLPKVKQRILEYLAVRKLKPEGKSPILCFVGPPGVGKTSLGQSIARAMGRKFGRISLGGVHDEAEIRGHRRTYIGAMPGNIIQAIRRAGTRNPVLMLDEMDKIGMGGFHGDPSSALLEVLDPEQNFSFADHYLAVPFDLTNVMFITTGNLADTIPSPLRDRMEIIYLSGYTDEEKLHIARKYLMPKQLDEHGITDKILRITDSGIRQIISHYTREAGVRSLERQIANLCRKIAKKVAEDKVTLYSVTAKNLHKYLGVPKYLPEEEIKKNEIGVATGLAWTEAGGDIIYVEAAILKGKGNLTLTGQLGDVMKESAHAALSYVRSRATSLGIEDDIFSKVDLHIHVPAG